MRPRVRNVFVSALLVLGNLGFAHGGQFVLESKPRHFRLVRERDWEPLMVAAATLGPNRQTNKARATLLAEAYFERHLGVCGGVERITENDWYWIFPTRVGYIGAPGPYIWIAKSTGTALAKDLPTVTDPSTYYRFVTVRRYDVK